MRYLTVALLLAACSSTSSSGIGSDLDVRTCEIGRDIAASYNVTDTLADSRARVVDLYNGYGKTASFAIQQSLRTWVSGMTTGDYDEAARGITGFDAACDIIGA